MSKTYIIITVIICVLCLSAVGALIFFNATPTGRQIWNNYQHSLQEADDDTLYETRKKVEDTCRAMISSYESDVLTYNQYKDSDSEEKQSWAEQAKMRANKTASSYNNYILENSYVWKDNVPSDIKDKLEVVE